MIFKCGYIFISICCVVVIYIFQEVPRFYQCSLIIGMICIIKALKKFLVNLITSSLTVGTFIEFLIVIFLTYQEVPKIVREAMFWIASNLVKFVFEISVSHAELAYVILVLTYILYILIFVGRCINSG